MSLTRTPHPRATSPGGHLTRGDRWLRHWDPSVRSPRGGHLTLRPKGSSDPSATCPGGPLALRHRAKSVIVDVAVSDDQEDSHYNI